jgi:hypothetical protein
MPYRRQTLLWLHAQWWHMVLAAAGSMTAASRFQRANGSTGSGLSALGGMERSESGAYRGPFGAAGEDPDHDYAAVMTGEASKAQSGVVKETLPKVAPAQCAR